MKILQTLFANPAPSKPFTGRGEGGYPKTNQNSKKSHPLETLKPRPFGEYFKQISTSEIQQKARS